MLVGGGVHMLCFLINRIHGTQPWMKDVEEVSGLRHAKSVSRFDKPCTPYTTI